MICQNCGGQIAADAKFCRHCGDPQGHAKAREVHEHQAIQTLSDEPRTERSFAGFWIRLAAFIFDLALIFIIFSVLSVVIGDKAYQDVVVKHGNAAIYTAFFIFNIFFLSTWSRTPGKALFGLTVVHAGTLSDISFGTALKRSLLQILSVAFSGIGYWNMWSDPKKQAFHDKRANTVVAQEIKSLWVPIILTAIAAAFIFFLSYSGSQMK